MGVATTRRGAAIAAALGVLLVVGGAAAGRAWLRGPDDVPPVPPGSAAVHERALAVYERFMGTVDQRNASYVVRNELMNGAMDRCMDRVGFPAWGDRYPRGYAVPVDPLDAGYWLAEPHRPFLSESLMAQRRSQATEDHANRDDIGEAETAAIDECLGTTPPASEGPVERRSSPQERWRLYEAWQAAITAYATDGHDVKEYVDCVVEADVPGLDPAILREEGLETAADGLRPPYGSVPSTPDDPLAGEQVWLDFLATERGLTDADWRCRAEVYSERIDGVLTVIERFEDEHADAIAKAEAQWEGVEAWGGRLE